MHCSMWRARETERPPDRREPAHRKRAGWPSGSLRAAGDRKRDRGAITDEHRCSRACAKRTGLTPGTGSKRFRKGRREATPGGSAEWTPEVRTTVRSCRTMAVTSGRRDRSGRIAVKRPFPGCQMAARWSGTFQGLNSLSLGRTAQTALSGNWHVVEAQPDIQGFSRVHVTGDVGCRAG